MRSVTPFMQLADTVSALFTGDRGLLAMDESTPTCNKRFAALGIPQDAETRRKYRDLIVTTPALGASIGGAILFDETIRQRTNAGIPFAQALEQAGIIPGIKVDEGAKDLPFHPGEKVTEGLDGLRDRLKEYSGMGARFAKWRAVIAIDKDIPSDAAIAANSHALARYAALCQEADIVPIVEPEVLMDGDHSLERCAEVTENVLHHVFDQLVSQRISLEGMILKPNMVIAGADCAEQNSVEEVADATVTTLLRSVPAAVPAIAFLSGGQSPEQASAHLDAMHARFRERLPWIVTFSFARAIQDPAMAAWGGHDENIEVAQKALRFRAECNRAARRGEYSATMEGK